MWLGWRTLAAFAGVGLLGVGWIVFGLDLAVPFGWDLAPPREFAPPYPPARLWPLLVTLAAAGVAVWRLAFAPRQGPLPPRRAAAAVTVLGLACFLLMQFSEAGIGRRQAVVNTVAATAATISNGYFVAALRVESLGSLLREYDELQRGDDKKLATHPPGAVIAYWLALRLHQHLPGAAALSRWLVDRFGGGYLDVRVDIARYPNVPPWMSAEQAVAAYGCALLIAALAATAVVPTYLLGAAGGDRRLGVAAAALLALMPNVALYHLSVDVLLMALAAWTLAAVVTAAEAQQTRWPVALAGGLALGASLLISVGAAPVVALAGVYLLLRVRHGDLSVRRAAGILGWLAAGVALLLGLAALGGLKLPVVYAQALDYHRQGGGGIAHRAYLPWLAYNVVCYAVFAGLPVALAGLEGLARDDWPSGPARALAWSLLATAVLLNLSGTVRAETERLWLFMNPLLAASAAAAAAGRPERSWPLAALLLQLPLMALALPPMVRPY